MNELNPFQKSMRYEILIYVLLLAVPTSCLLLSKSNVEIPPCTSNYDSCPISSINSLSFPLNSTGTLLCSVHIKNTTLIQYPNIKLRLRYFLDFIEESHMSFAYKIKKLKSFEFANAIDLPTKKGTSGDDDDTAWFVLLSATVPDFARVVIVGIEHIFDEKNTITSRIPFELIISKPDCNLPNTVNSQKFSITDNPCFLNLPISRADEATCKCKQDSYFIPPTKVNLKNLPKMMGVLWTTTKDPFILILVLNIGIVLAYILAKFYQDKKLLHRSVILKSSTDQFSSDLENFQAVNHHYIVTVFTGSRPFSGLNHRTTDVYIRLIGDQNVSDKILLNFGEKTLKRASVDCFLVSSKKPIGRLCGVEVYLEGTSCWYFSRLSVFNCRTNKKYYVSAGKWFNFGWFNNRPRKEYFMCDFKKKYIGSLAKAKNTLSDQVEYGNPFIRAFWSAGKWPTFSPTDRSCIFMITLSFTCLITAVWLDAVVINETIINIFGTEYDVTNLKLAFQIEFFVIMPIDMLVEWVFAQYRNVRTMKLSVLYESYEENDDDDELEPEPAIQKIIIKTNRLPRRDAKRMGILVVFSCCLLGFIAYLFTFAKLANEKNFENGKCEFCDVWVEVMIGEIIEEFTFIHPLFCCLGTVISTIFDSEIDWDEWMPFNIKKVKYLLKYLRSFEENETDDCDED